MTATLEKAFAKAADLPEALQDQLAAQLLEDIKAETKWDRTLARSQVMLEKMAQTAVRAKRAGKTRRGGF